MRQLTRPSWRVLLTALLLLVLGMAGATVQADSYDDRRVRTAARLLRALLAADEGLERKRDEAGQLQVWVYVDRDQDVAALRRLIAPDGSGDQAKVRGMGIAVSSTSTIPASGAALPALVFLAQPLASERFQALRDWCIAEGVILYSPFDGDVERGATAGLSVQAKVQPYVNLGTLRSSGIRLRRFYLDHSRVLQ